jgi:hypothetical protein
MVNIARPVKPLSDETLLIHHSGTIHHLYADAIANFLTLLERLAAKQKIKIIVEFWGDLTLTALERILKMPLGQQGNQLQIKVCGYAESLIVEQQRADFLLLVNSFAPGLKKQLRYSFSSKTTEYLVSGTPILLYAPPYSSLVAHLGQHGAAHIICAEEPEAALQQLEQIVDDPNRQCTVTAAQRLARECHNEECFFKVISQS